MKINLVNCCQLYEIHELFSYKLALISQSYFVLLKNIIPAHVCQFLSLLILTFLELPPVHNGHEPLLNNIISLSILLAMLVYILLYLSGQVINSPQTVQILSVVHIIYFVLAFRNL